MKNLRAFVGIVKNYEETLTNFPELSTITIHKVCMNYTDGFGIGDLCARLPSRIDWVLKSLIVTIDPPKWMVQDGPRVRYFAKTIPTLSGKGGTAAIVKFRSAVDSIFRPISEDDEELIIRRFSQMDRELVWSAYER